MKVLMITGDKSFKAGHPRFELQRGAVEELAVVYWGRGSLWPSIPNGPFDVVTSQDPLLRGMYAWRAAKKIRARFNVQVHMDLNGLPWWKHVLAQIVLRHADSVRVVSDKIKQQVLHFGVRVPVHVLPVYIDITKFQNIIRVPHEQKTILWIGRFEEEKDPALALSVLVEVRAKGLDAKLVMLGAGSESPQLQKLAEGLPVEFPGWQDPLPYIARTDVVVSTSKHESYGASIVEALAASVPVVAPDVGIAKAAGAMVVGRDKLAEKIIEVLKNPPKAELKIPILTKEEWTIAWIKTL